MELLPGDTTDMDFGLSGAKFMELARSVDVIHHCAFVSYAGARRELAEKVNVQGTGEVLELAETASHLSQPAFSALIRQLEESLGVRLFERSTRHVELSAEGEEFERSARRVLAEFDAAVAGMRERAARERGRVSIALLPSLAAD